MKRVFFLLLTIIVCAATQAQVRFGVRGGLNVSSIVGKDANDYTAKAGLFLGGLAKVPVTGRFSVQPEVNISIQGGKWDGYDGSTKLTYLNFPVLAKFTTRSGFYGETGPQVGFLISAKDMEDGDHDDIMEHLKKTDFSWAVGAGYHFTPEIGVHARYNAGLNSFYETEKNSVFQVGLTYMFPQR